MKGSKPGTPTPVSRPSSKETSRIPSLRPSQQSLPMVNAPKYSAEKPAQDLQENSFCTDAPRWYWETEEAPGVPFTFKKPRVDLEQLEKFITPKVKKWMDYFWRTYRSNREQPVAGRTQIDPQISQAEYIAVLCIIHKATHTVADFEVDKAMDWAQTQWDTYSTHQDKELWSTLCRTGLVDTKEWEEVWQGEATFIKPQKRERGLGVARGLARGWWEKSMMALVHSWTESAEEEECIHFLSTLYHRTTLVQTDTGRRGWRCLDEVVPCLRPCLDPSDMHVHRGATATAKSKVKNGLTTSLTPSMREIITQFHGGKPEDKAKQGQPEGRVARWGGLGKPRNHSESSNFSQEEKPYWWVGERDNKGPSSIKDNKQNTIYPFESFVVPSLQLHLAHLTEEQGKEKRSIEDDHTLSSLPDQPTRNPEDKLPASYHREALSSRTHLLMMTGKIISYLDFHQDPYIRYLFSSPGGERPPPDDIQLKEQAEVESRQRMLKLKAFGKKQPSRKPFGKMISKVITNNNRDPFSKTTPEQSLSHTDMKAMDNAALLATKARMSQTQPSLAKHSGVGDKYEEQEAGLTKTKTLGGADAEIDWEAMVQQPPPVEEGPDVDSDSEDASPRISMVVQDSPPKASEITPTPSAPLVMKEPEAVLRPSTRQIEDPGAKAEEAPKSNKETDKYVPMAPGFSTDDLLLRGGSDVFDGESFDMAKSRLSLKKVLPAPEDEMGTKPGVVASPKRVQPGYNNIKEPRDPPKNEQDPSPPVLRASGRISQPSPQAEFAGPALVVTKASVTHTPTLVAPTPLAPMPKSVKIEATESEEVQQTAEEAAEEARMSKIRLWGDAKKTTTTTEETVEETVEEEEGDDEKTDSDEGEDETSPKERPKRAFALQDVDDSEVPDDADRAESAKERHKRAKRERKNPRKKPVGTTINDQVETPEQESQLQEYVPSALALQTPPAGPSAPTEADTQSRQVVLESYLESVGVLGGEANADSSTAESTLVSGSSSELVATAASSTAPGAVDTAELPDAPSDSGAEAQAASGSLEAEDALGLNEEVIAAAPSSSNDLIAAAIVGAPAIPSASEILSVPSGLVDDDVVEAQVEADREVAEAQVDAVGSLRDIVVADAPPISEADLTPQSAPRGQRRRVLRKRNTKLDASVVDDPATIARQDGALVGGGDEPATARQNDALKGGGGDDSQVRVIQEDGREVRIIKVVGASGYEEEWEEYSEHGSDAGGDEADDEEEYDAAHEEAVTERSDSTSKVTQNHSEKGNVTQIYNEKGKVTKNYSEKSSRRPEKQKKAIHQDGVVMRTDGLAESHADNGGDLSVQVSATTTPEQLQATFSAFGAVVGIEVLKDTGGHSRTAIISFDSAGSAAKALSGLNGVMLDEKHLIISPAERVEDTNTDTGTPMHHFRAAPRLVLPIIHVKNVSEKTTEEQLRSVFAKFGKVTACALKVGSSHVFQGVAVVNFKTCESAAQALAEMNGALLDDNHLVVSPAQRVEHHDVESDQVFVHYTATYRSSQFADLFVKNLSEGTTQDSLQQEFAAFAISTSCEVFSDAKGKSWGMAIACFATPEDAQKALLGMNGRTVAGHKLAVTQTRRRRRAPQSGQGYSQRYKAYGGAGQLTKHTVEDKTLMGLLVNEGREGPEEWWESFSESDSTAEGTEVKSHTHADEYAGGETGSAEDGASARAGGRSTDENASVTSGDMPELRTKTTRPRHRGRRPLRASIVAVTGMGAAVAALRDYDRAKALEAGGEQSEIGETATDSPSRGTVLDDKKSRLHNLRKTSEFDDLARVRESQGTTSGQEESGPVDEEQRVGDIDEDRASEGEKSEEDSETGRQSRKLEEPQQPSPPLLDFAGLAGSETYRSENQTKRESEDPEDHARKGGGYRTGRAKHGIDSEEGRPQRKPSRRQSKVTNNEEERKANLSEPMPSGRLEGGASWSWAPDGLGEEPATFSGRALPGRTPLKNAKSANVSFPRSLNTLRRGDSSDSFDSSRRRSTIEPLVSDELDVWASSSIHDDLDLKAEARLARDVSIAELQLRVPLSGPKNGLRSANGQKTAQTPLHRLSVSAGGVPVYGSVALGQRAEKYLTAEGAMLSPRRLAENTGTDQGSFSARARLAPSNATLSGGVNGAQPWSHDASFVDSAGNSFLTETEEWDNRQWTRPKTAGSDPVSGPGAVTQFTTEDGVIPLMRHDFQIPERPTAFVSDRKDTHDLISVQKAYTAYLHKHDVGAELPLMRPQEFYTQFYRTEQNTEEPQQSAPYRAYQYEYELPRSYTAVPLKNRSKLTEMPAVSPTLMKNASSPKLNNSTQKSPPSDSQLAYRKSTLYEEAEAIKELRYGSYAFDERKVEAQAYLGNMGKIRVEGRPFQPASEQSVVTGHGESPESPRPEDGVGLAGSQYHRGGTVRTTVRKRPLTVDAWAKRVGKTPSTKRLPALLEPNGRPTTPAFVDDFRSVKHGFSMRPLKTGYVGRQAMVSPGAAHSILAASTPEGRFFVEHAKANIKGQKWLAQSASLPTLHARSSPEGQPGEAGVPAFSIQDSVVKEEISRQVFADDNAEYGDSSNSSPVAAEVSKQGWRHLPSDYPIQEYA